MRPQTTKPRKTSAGFASIGLVCTCGVFIAQQLSAQDQPRADGEFRPSGDGLDVATFADADVRVSADESESARLSVRKLRVDAGADGVEMPDLPERGFVFLQHKSGDVVVVAGDIRYEPYEGEWMTIVLPQRIVFVTEDDAALLDAIVLTTE